MRAIDEQPRLAVSDTAASAPESFLVEGLFDLLDHQQALCGKLADVMEREQQAILAADTDSLEAVCDEKCVMIEDICRLDRQREHILQQLQKLLGVRGKPPSLTQLAELMPRDAAKSLQHRAAGLASSVRRVARITDQTRHLLNAARDLTDGLRAILTGAATTTVTYRKSGKLLPVESAGHLMSGTI